MSWREDELESLPTDTRQAIADGPAAAVNTQVMEMIGDEWQRDLDSSSFIRLLEEIDSGGMGQVLEAWDLDLRRPLAVKVLHQRWRDRAEVRELFVEEARLTAALEHPHIVPVHTLGSRPDTGPFFTMKRVEGQTLLEHLRKVRRSLRGDVLDEVVGMVIKVCDALALAHSRGISHGDLKASNIMVGKYGEVYLMDWGNARRFPSPPLRNSKGEEVLSGTPAIMAPEQAVGGEVDQRTDVFGIGTLLYFILARRTPYRGKEPMARIAAAALCRHPSLDEVAPRTPSALRAIATRAMSRDPADRHPDIECLREELDLFRRGRLAVPKVRVAEGDVLIKQGEVSDYLYVVEEGTFLIVRQSDDGTREEIREVGPGAVVGEIGLIAGKRRTASVVATTEGVVRMVPEERLEEELERLPDWLRRIMETLATRFHEREAER